ncbi:MAG: efflux RND transporter periplasmic adaptor subunit [Muribaculaceae bacterium]
MKSISKIACIALAALSACGAPQSTPSASSVQVPVTTMKVQLTTVNRQFTVSGNIEGRTTAKMAFLVAGRISSIKFKEGETVKKGQLIATIEPTNYSIARQLAQVQVNQAQDEFNRVKMLYDSQSVSESDFKKCQFALEGAKAQLQLREKDLSDTHLHSEMTGIILNRSAEVGEIVNSGIPVAVIADISTVNVCAYIPENALQHISIGCNAKVDIDAIGKHTTARVSEIGGVADPTTRAFTVKLSVENGDYAIRPGMIAQVTFTQPNDTKCIAIPCTCLMHTPEGRPYVYVADLTEHRAYTRNVSIGETTGNQVVITSGLNEGDVIVTTGQHKLTNGAKIK